MQRREETIADDSIEANPLEYLINLEDQALEQGYDTHHYIMEKLNDDHCHVTR